MKKDGHIHTPYCPHGTLDSFHRYIEKAIEEGFDEITFTEHAPLPAGFQDPTPQKDSGMDINLLEKYITDLEELKKQYKQDIVISTGLEVDYISNFEEETANFLDTYGKYLDDSILSVHFLYDQQKYVCIDYSKETFLEFVQLLGEPSSVYKLYYKTVMDSIKSELGKYKPKRFGHITLVHKFQLALSENINDEHFIREVLQELKNNSLQLDFNSAGLAKPYCKETYPPLPFVQEARDLGIPIIFGSDAHQVKDLHQFYKQIEHLL